MCAKTNKISFMAKHVKRYKTFTTVAGGGNAVKCNNCDKTIRGGYESSNLFRLWSKYFCGLKCAESKGYRESRNIFYRLEKKIMGR